MRGKFFGNSDIELYFEGVERNHIRFPHLGIENGRLKQTYKTFECELMGLDGSPSGFKASAQGGEFDNYGDGIEVALDGKTYSVRINAKAAELAWERGKFGTRYGHGEKVDLFFATEQSPA